MSPAERRILIRSLVLLALAGAGRGMLEARAGATAHDPLAHLPDRAAALDSAAVALAAEEELRTRPLAEGERLDVNRATAADFDRLPGVGPALAARIVAHRTREGPFASVDGLDEVAGIGPATLARIGRHLEAGGAPPTAGTLSARAAAQRAAALGPLRVGAPPALPAAAARRPVLDLNRADSVALLALPGIGPAMAGRILAARRARGRFERVDDLLGVSGIGERTLGRLRPHVEVGAVGG